MATPKITRDREPGWHVGKEIPLALIFAIAVQSGGWIWWASSQSAKLDYLAKMMGEFKTSQYTQEDARRDKEILMTRDADIVRRVEVLEGKAR